MQFYNFQTRFSTVGKFDFFRGKGACILNSLVGLLGLVFRSYRCSRSSQSFDSFHSFRSFGFEYYQRSKRPNLKISRWGGRGQYKLVPLSTLGLLGSFNLFIFSDLSKNLLILKKTQKTQKTTKTFILKNRFYSFGSLSFENWVFWVF